MNYLYKTNHMNKRGPLAPQKNKFSFKKATSNTIQSLNEVGCFIEQFNIILKYYKIYKLLK